MRRTVFAVVLMVILLQSLVGCVSQPRYSDYIGMKKEVALDELQRKKNANTTKLIINWLTAGYFTFWVASIADTIRLVSFVGHFKRIEEQIKATPPGAEVGQNAAEQGTRNEEKLDKAISNASVALAERIPRNSTIAVLSVSTANRNTSEYIISELEYHFVNTGRFRIVDRRRLDQIRTEQNFQISGDVSDASAVSIGNMLGANIVITGEITGSGANQRLLLKALDVQTAQIITMSREDL